MANEESKIYATADEKAMEQVHKLIDIEVERMKIGDRLTITIEIIKE